MEKLELCIKVLFKISKKEQHVDGKKNLMWRNQLWNVDCIWLSEVMAQHSCLCRGFWTLEFRESRECVGKYYCQVKEVPLSEWNALLVNTELVIYWICGKSVYHWFLLKWSQFKLWLLLLRFFMTFFRYSKGLLKLSNIECRLYPLQLIIHITFAVQKSLLSELWSNSSWVSVVMSLLTGQLKYHVSMFVTTSRCFSFPKHPDWGVSSLHF